MSYYRTCPTCGANLDPGETCEDCREKESAAPALTHRDGKNLCPLIVGHDGRKVKI